MTSCEDDQHLLLLRQHEVGKSLSKYSHPKSNKHKLVRTRELEEEAIIIIPTSATATTRTSNHHHHQKSHLKEEDEFRRRHKRQLISYNLTSLLTIIVLLLASKITNQEVSAFNVDTHSAVVHSGPANSYFGYTVAQHIDRGVNWLLVGAPKAQTNQAKIKEAGAVYRCSTTVSGACQQIPFDPTGPSFLQLGNESRQSDDKSYQWFGASLGSAIENGSIIACAPKYVYFSTNLKRRDPVGNCWVSRGAFSGFLNYSPCRLNEQWGHHHLGSCQAGFSSAISKDGKRIFMGAPGSHVWQGQVFAHNLNTDLTSSTSGVNPHSEDDSYIGYSLALGRFSSQSVALNSASSDADVAIGIPRDADLAGKIMIVDREMRILRNITGEQMGAYFGYSIATADVNGDGLDDLIIGAPLYYNQTISHKEAHFERGRIYVALQNRRHEFSITNRIDGHKNRARFGTAIANCGDLNRDGFQDIAVGAPYDGPENRGAIYIFMGRKFGLSEEADQIIYAENIRNGLETNYLRSFGFSLSAGLDMDGNQYPDLLIGDYQGDRAIMLRTRPVINVTTTLNFQPEYFNLDDKKCLLPNSSTSVSCILVEFCMKYNGADIDNRIPFVFDTKLDTENKGAPRLFLLSNPGKNEDKNTTTLTKDVQQCKSFKAYIIRQIRDKLTPLKVDIEYNLADSYLSSTSDSSSSYDFSTTKSKLKPILNKSNPNKISKIATIQKNCGYDNVCLPDLKLTLTPNIDQYTIGSNEKLILDVTVKNYGEDAFESMFYLTMPLTINYITTNKTRSDYPICYGAKPDQTGVNILTCDLGNPQQRNDIVKFSVITEPAKGVFSAPDFTFIANVNSTNPEFDDKAREDNQVAIGIPIKVEVNLVLSGNSNPASVLHNSTYSANNNLNKPKLSEADIGQEVTHTYQLQNRGPSTINDIALTILWPTMTKDGQYLLYLVDEPETSDKVVCKPAPRDAINPLGFKYLRGNSINPSANTNFITRQQTTNQNLNNRYKRQTATTSSQQPSDQTSLITTTTVDNSILQQLDLLTCGPTQCNRFECNVFDLGNNELATIKIRSRLWEETLNQISLQDFDISSKLVAQVKALPYNVSSKSMPPYVYKVETQVHTTGLAVQDLLSWWVVALAILLGIALFILLACFLKYLGFFARKRPPKGAEREPLTPTLWNDYQYTPGDTAL